MEHPPLLPKSTMRRIPSSGLPFLLALAVAAACSPAAERSEQTGGSVALDSLPRDVHSYAQPDEARVTHVSLDLIPDFATKRIAGTARLAIQRAATADSIILDVRDLTIARIATPGGDTLGYRVGTANEIMGAPLAIALPAQGDTIVI